MRNSLNMSSAYCSQETQKLRFAKQDTSSESGSNSDYVQFLREKERIVGPDGFLDSQRYRSSYEFKQKSRRSSDDLKKKRILPVVNVSSRNVYHQKDVEKQKQPYSKHEKMSGIDEPKREKNDYKQLGNFQKRSIELQRQQYEDRLKHIKRFVTKEQQQESEIFSKKEQLQVKKNEMKHQNDRIAQEQKDVSQKETKLVQSLQERSFLEKITIKRNDFHWELKKLLEQLRHDQFQLEELN